MNSKDEATYGSSVPVKDIIKWIEEHYIVDDEDLPEKDGAVNEVLHELHEWVLSKCPTHEVNGRCLIIV